MSKKIENDEIDLIDVILILWGNKFKIISSIVFAVIIMLIYLNYQKPTVILTKATTEIKPISIFDEFKYETYNSYLKSISKRIRLEEAKSLGSDELSLGTNISIPSSFKFIKKEYLLNLFIDRLDENSIFIEAIKKFDLIKKENYPSTKQYDNAVTKLAASIKIVKELPPNGNRWLIESTIRDRITWEKFLIYVSEITNKEIQKYLSEIFNITILNEKTFLKYQIEDIEIQIQNNQDDQISKKNLTKKRTLLKANKDLERMRELFANTPVITSENFYAGKIMVLTTKYQDLNSASSKLRMLILAGVLGAIFGIIIALISNVLKKKHS